MARRFGKVNARCLALAHDLRTLQGPANRLFFSAGPSNFARKKRTGRGGTEDAERRASSAAARQADPRSSTRADPRRSTVPALPHRGAQLGFSNVGCVAQSASVFVARRQLSGAAAAPSGAAPPLLPMNLAARQSAVRPVASASMNRFGTDGGAWAAQSGRSGRMGYGRRVVVATEVPRTALLALSGYGSGMRSGTTCGPICGIELAHPCASLDRLRSAIVDASDPRGALTTLDRTGHGARNRS